MESQLWLLWAALAVALVYYHLSRRRDSGHGRRSPPGPRPLPLLGNILDLRGGNLHHTLARLAGAHGPVMMLKLGLTTTVVVSSRDVAKEAYTKHDRHLAARAVPDAANAMGYSQRSMIWLPSSDPLWKTLRGAVASNIFSPRGLAAARGVHERKVRDLVAYLRGRAGEEVDVGQALYGGTLNLVSAAFLSVDLVDVGAESAHGVREIVEDLVAAIATPNVSDLFPFLRPLDVQGWRRWARGHYQKIFGIFGTIVDARLALLTVASDAPHGDFLDSLLELVSTGKISRDSVVTMLFDVLAAGSEAIAVTVEWAMAELLRNPRIMAKVRAEMGDYCLGCNKDAIEELDTEKLMYLQAVVKEVMRLHPVGPILLPHQAVAEGVELGGYAVPKGSTVIFNAWAIMRDPQSWERADEFVPERFMDMADNKVEFHGKDFQFIPFGSGRRLCPGLPMAERLVPFILASLLQAFEWRLSDGVSADELDVSEKFSYVNTLAVPLKAVPIAIV